MPLILKTLPCSAPRGKRLLPVPAAWALSAALAASLVLAACGRKSNPAGSGGDAPRTGYYTENGRIMKDGCERELRGTDKMSVFGADFSEPESWGMDVVRECIDMKCNSDADLGRVVQAARSAGFVVILTAFWYDSDAFAAGSTPYPDCQLLGAVPTRDARFAAVQARWRGIAARFKNQSDVWFGVWNEPYGWRKEDTATPAQWLEDAAALVDNIRSTGAENIVVVCGSAMGQGHEPFIEKGAELLEGRGDIVFDVHAYRTYWDVPAATIRQRLDAIRTASGAPVIVGEFAANGEHPWRPVMDACRATRTPLLAWLWGQYEEPFAAAYRAYCLETRNLSCKGE